MSSPSATVSAGNPPNSTKDLIAQYELGDDAPPAETEASSQAAEVNASASAAETPAGVTGEPVSPRPTPPRDPETGKFLPRAEAPETHQHSPRVRATALRLGVSEEEIARTTPEHLEEIVYHLTGQLTALRQERAQEASRESRATDRLPEQPAQAQAAEQPPEDELAFEEGSFDPTIEKFMKVARDQAKQIKELTALVGQLVQNEHVRFKETMGQRIDRVFDSLGSDYEPFLGKGRGNEMRPDEPALQRRKAVLAMVEMDKSKSTLEEKIKRVAQTLYGVRGAPIEQPERPSKQRNGYTTEEWNAGGLQRPTNRAGAGEPPGEEKAVKGVERYLRENGQSVGHPVARDDFPE